MTTEISDRGINPVNTLNAQVQCYERVAQRNIVRFRKAANEPQCSVSIPLSHDLKKRLDQYLDVEPKAPIIDVP